MDRMLTDRMVRRVGEYQVNTASALLVDAVSAVEEQMRGMWNLPPDLDSVPAYVQAVARGEEVPDWSSVGPQAQAFLAVQLCNVFRLVTDAVDGDLDGCDPEVLAGIRRTTDNIFSAMAGMDPGIAMLAIRNSIAWEARNRRGHGHDWSKYQARFMVESMPAMSLFKAIRAAHWGP